MLAKYPPRRGGFTLVELMVVIGIILVLTALAVTVAYSGILDSHKISSSSDRVAGWLLQARAKAQREGRPSGVRFLVGPDGFIREAQLIEVPDPFNLPAGNQLMIEQVNNSPVSRRIFIVGPQAATLIAEISIGDTLSIPSLGTIHRVSAVPAAVANIAGQPAVQIFVVDPTKIPDIGAAALPAAAIPNPPTPTYSTPTFGFIRQARPTMGEPTLLVPNSIAIDGALSQPAMGPNSSFDLVFSPNGEVQNAGSIGRIVLWIRNPDFKSGLAPATISSRPVYEASGEMVFVVVYTKTGAVGTQPVALPPSDPYSTTRDGISTGL